MTGNVVISYRCAVKIRAMKIYIIHLIFKREIIKKIK